MNEPKAVPVVMTFAGNDPTGGAGIQADIEAIISMGCHAAPVVTALTVQDTTSVQGFAPIDAELIIQQARAVLEDMPVAAAKIGMVGSIEAVQAIHTILMDYPDIPVVLDPVISAGGGGELANEEVVDGLRSLLLPLTTVLTPNSLEARRLAPESDNLDACAMALLDHGAEFVLITGSHENTPEVHNTLYGNRRKLETFTWPRLEGSYHGSGCTLASAIAGLLAQGTEPLSAAHEAQEFTWQALNHGYRIGMGQRLPNRLFWASPDEEHD
ncbi:bifunctional hydroxymethylpyrimidine kinase/phosphomethylpyrimidine kinase [Thioalkalivibrio sulfidiphilus]|uniref:hydroxymethylpyrimidine kinase n=1 Tax=Thioalkalivibrio sulfidiphilus (strain HL-EbGR7) TaxID=396588 RepID=B8GLE2_THISH|nr:hydroxymethylpyrimidine/phosphomethylpyrimidine kinase [Thioalkalivibrio sulfidiphilus]ACL73497.1 Phosphomethylpyrimidine kinase [Thioalkalivibrio sulfidiphilus HL-EbGr7]